MSDKSLHPKPDAATNYRRYHSLTCGWGCSCLLRRRWLQGGALALLPTMALDQALAREGVEVGRNSVFTQLVSAEELEQAAAQQYRQTLKQAASQRALAPENHPQLKRLRAIAQRIIPFALDWNPRASGWKWEINLIGSKEVNAYCMPGGKIVVYTGILDQLKLDDEESATVMGHEVAHALREHARERMGKQAATGLGANLLGLVLGLGQLGQTLTNYGAQLLTLKFSREDESEADLVGMELAARAGFDPGAGVSLWEKMAQASKGAPPQWLSTHPAGKTRIADIQANLPKVMPLYERAESQKPR